MATINDLGTVWDNLLSRDAVLIRTTFSTLSSDEKAAVLSHLQRMASESGWHIEQCTSARFALQALGDQRE